ncbi:MAG: hypothetical protein KDK64_06005 [Chlamydiia bacterium]|nr:hypothetical protein [Chlamydiia bacterium]
MSEIMEIGNSFLEEGLDTLEKDLQNQKNAVEIKAVRIFMTIQNENGQESILRTLETNTWTDRQIRTFLPGLCFLGVFFGTSAAFFLSVVSMCITRIAMEKIFGEPNKYSRVKALSFIHQAFNELGALDPSRIHRYAIEIELTHPRLVPFTSPQNKTYMLYSFNNKEVKQLFMQH